MEQSFVLRRRQFLLTMLGAAAVSTRGRGVLDHLVSPTYSARPIDLHGDPYRYIKGLGLPDHPTGEFPNAHCPGYILAQNHDFRVLKAPQPAGNPTPLAGWLFGIAVNGVVFDPTGPFYFPDPTTRSSWQFEVLTTVGRPALGIDANNAHTQPSGEYHYHGMPYGLITGIERSRSLRGEGDSMLLLGWAADGFPIYGPLAHSDPWDPRSPLVAMRSSYAQRSGPRTGEDTPGGRYDDHPEGVFVQDFEYRPGSGDLDECNGRQGVTPEYPVGTYYYVVTSQFPYVPRMWRGTPDDSFWHPSPGYAGVPRELRALQL